MTEEGCYDEVVQARRAAERLRDVYDLEFGDVSTTKRGATQMFLKTSVTGVRIYCAPWDGYGLDVEVGRLVNGEFPMHPGSIDDQTVLHAFDIRDLAALAVDTIRGPLRQKIKDDASLTADDVVVLLDTCCGNILRGEFSIFDEASLIVKRRAKQLSKEYPKIYPAKKPGKS